MTAKFDKTSGDVELPPPLLGEHTNEILGEMGYTIYEIEKLRENNII
jgi:crotonobetainyl-CoA:carnitine CoA-transferase CaiB-like acyl-CoA transferase